MEVEHEDKFDPLVELGMVNSQLDQITLSIAMLKVTAISASQKPSFEPWHSALIIDFIYSLENICEQLRETAGKERISAVAWLTRSLLELLVWIKFCRSSRENAWKFHEDALRDTQGLIEAYAKTCGALGINDKNSLRAMAEIQTLAKNELGLNEIKSNYLDVSKAAKATDSIWSESFTHINKALSKFAHPTAALIHGILPKVETQRDLQVCFAIQGVHFASHCVAELEAILGVVEAIPLAVGFQAKENMPAWESWPIVNVETTSGGPSTNFFWVSQSGPSSNGHANYSSTPGSQLPSHGHTGYVGTQNDMNGLA